MSSDPTFTQPQLNYVGAVDVATSYGSTRYTISFDASMATIGNILMFEYKIQSAGILVTDPSNVTLGYINVENALFTSGIANQWTISVPACDNDYEPNPVQTIQVRVYSGLTGTTEISVSQWSNSLDIHVSPNQPTIFST